MSSLIIEFPEDVLQALEETPEEFAREAQILLAAKLYEIGRLSLDKATELAAMGSAEFLAILKSYQEPIAGLSGKELKGNLRPHGLCAGEFSVPDDFDEPLPDRIIAEFEGE
jgi:predicted HTH domain antitoxin